MKSIFSQAAVILLLSNSFFAQTFEWAAMEHYSVTTFGNDIDIDSEGNVYVSGCYLNDEPHPPQNSPYSGFITKYSANGEKQWTITDVGQNLRATISLNEIIAVGKNAGMAWFINRYNLDGHLQSNNNLFPRYEGHFTETFNATIDDVATDKAGNIIITGRVYDTLAIGSYSYVNAHKGNSNPLYVAKLTREMQPIWVKTAKSGHIFVRSKLCVSNTDRIYVYGEFMGQMVFENYTLNGEGFSDGYIFQISTLGQIVSRYHLTGVGQEQIAGIGIDDTNELSVIGYHDQKVEIGTFSLSPPKEFDGNTFLARFDKDFAVRWAKTIGSEGTDAPAGISLDQSGNMYVAINSRNSSVSFDKYSMPNESPGYYQSNVAKFSTAGDCLWAVSAKNRNESGSASMALSSDANKVMVTGMMQGEIDFGVHPFMSIPRSMFLTIILDKDVTSGLSPSQMDSQFTAILSEGILTLSFTTSTAETVRVRVLDYSGRIVYSDSRAIIQGPNVIRTPIVATTGSPYLIELITEGQQMTRKVIAR